MKRNKHAGRLLPACLLAALTIPFASTAQEDKERGAAELVTDYLKQDIFLRPGIGLKKVSIDMDFEEVLQAWGPPASRRRTGAVDNRWVYEVADHTRITLVGGNRVEVIRVAGGFSSPYVTTEGAAFGMAQHQLSSIYGHKEAASGKVDYEARGIGFELERGQVSEIRVFSPE